MVALLALGATEAKAQTRAEDDSGWTRPAPEARDDEPDANTTEPSAAKRTPGETGASADGAGPDGAGPDGANADGAAGDDGAGDAAGGETARLHERIESLAERLERQERELAELKAERSGSKEDDDLDALLQEVGASDLNAYAAPEPLLLYGFSDFGFNQIFARSDNSLLGTLPAARSTFVVGNLNLFLDANPAKNVRSLVELRFTNLPHGNESSLVPYVRQDTRAADVTDPSSRRRVVVGSVIIERAYAQYSPMDEFQLMVGQWFTPFGIWNVDHANPTLISLLLPIAQVDQFMPDRLVGVQAQGTFHLKGGFDLGYHVHLSNGRTESLLDFTPQKALGGRVFLAAPAAKTPWKVGISGYTGELDDRVKELTSINPLVIRENVTIRGREHVVGADASLDVGALRLRAEGVFRTMAYEDGHRPHRGGGYYAPDRSAWDAYVLGAYRLPWFGLEPYLWFEAMQEANDFADTVLVPSAGLNVHFTPAVLLKTQFARVLFLDSFTESNRDPSALDLSYLTSRFVVSF